MIRLAYPNAAFRLAALLAAVLLLPACSGRRFFEKPPEAPLVKVSTVQKGTLPQVLAFTGVLRAKKRASVSAGTSGVVLRVGVRDGDQVSQGQPVVWLDDTELQSRVREQEAAVAVSQARIPELETNVAHSESKVRAGVEQARESLKQAQIQVQSTRTQLASDKSDKVRMESLYKEKAVPRHQVEQAQLKYQLTQDQLSTALSKLRASEENLRLQEAGRHDTQALRAQLEGARASLRQAQATLESTRVTLGQMVIRAPMTGIVVDRAVEPGQAVSGGSKALLSVVDNGRLECDSSIDQRVASLVRHGMRATLRAGRGPEEPLVGTVSDVIPAGDPKTLTVRVRFTVENRESRKALESRESREGWESHLMEGVAVNGRITLREHKGILVPHRALHRADQKPWVMVVRKSTIEVHPVDVTYEDESWYLVTRGLEAGDVVVTEGAELATGTAVTVEQSQLKP